MSDPYVGEIRLVGFTFAPQGWLPCDGRVLPISEFDVLYTLLGTTYGGDGQATFRLPDLQGRVPVGRGTGPGRSTRTVGQVGGRESVALAASNMPMHTHAWGPVGVRLPATDGPATTNRPVGKVPAAGGSYAAEADGTSAAIPLNGTAAPTGGNAPVAIGPPSLTMQFIIATAGIYPSPS
jgi:microcystin-dependent protein